jgi:hypothetical protein
MSDETVKQRAQQLGTELNTIHRNGAGTIDLVHLLELSGLPAPTPGDPRLLGRTEVAFTATGPAGGVFQSAGPAVEIATEVASIVIPVEVKGTYESRPDGFALSFAPEGAPFDNKSTAATRLQVIRVDPDGVAFQLGGFLGSVLSRRVAFAEFAAPAHPLHIVNIIRAAYFEHMGTGRG